MSGTCDSGHVFILSRLSHSPYVAHCRSARAPLLAQTIAFALRADVISEHGTEYEVLLRSKLVERTVHHPPYGMNALPLSEEQVHLSAVHRLHHEVDVLPPQTAHRRLLILSVHREEHHLSHALLQLIYMIHEHLQFGGMYLSPLHCLVFPPFLMPHCKYAGRMRGASPCVRSTRRVSLSQPSQPPPTHRYVRR